MKKSIRLALATAAFAAAAIAPGVAAADDVVSYSNHCFAMGSGSVGPGGATTPWFVFYGVSECL